MATEGSVREGLDGQGLDDGIGDVFGIIQLLFVRRIEWVFGSEGQGSGDLVIPGYEGLGDEVVHDGVAGGGEIGLRRGIDGFGGGVSKAEGIGACVAGEHGGWVEHVLSASVCVGIGEESFADGA